MDWNVYCHNMFSTGWCEQMFQVLTWPLSSLKNIYCTVYIICLGSDPLNWLSMCLLFAMFMHAQFVTVHINLFGQWSF